ncbi:MAG: CHAT domain-containing protein [Candidatus Competibacteraceae bacterium]
MTTLFRIEPDRLCLRCEQVGLDESRPLTAADPSQFRGWLQDYRNHLRGHGEETARLRLGREMYAWLDGDAGWLARLREAVEPPWIVELRAPRDPGASVRLFLQLPWELLADDRGYLAADLALRYAPVRRLGEPTQPAEPSPCRLSLVFMAAAPRAPRRLDYEAEEAAILDATAKIGLDLTVEESGALEWLAARVAEEAPVDVLHLSCHGQGGANPALCLETDEGAIDSTSVECLIEDLSTHRPRLLFLSACHTAESAETGDGTGIVDSLALALLRAGMPAVLGWDGPVSDAEAAEFAAHLYQQLSRKADLQAALAEARFALLNPQGVDPLARSRDWHLARLFLGSTGGGPLVKGDRARHRKGIEGGHKEFLDVKGKQVPVAGRLEFVGRRRPLQDALRELRRRDRAGVLIHGMGRQGKSSLAARVANRLHHHEPVVVFGRYDAPAILEAFRRAVGGRKVRDIIDAYRDRIHQRPEELADCLRELLEGPCQQLVKQDDGSVTNRPVLLILDDLERILCDPGPAGLHRVQPELVPVLRAVVEAFAKADGDSRLLITSRFRFTLPQQDGRDLADALFPLHLPPMEAVESRQQAARKARPTGQAKAAPDEARTQRCIGLARGNPGLQDRLFSLSLQDPAACDQALAAMEHYLAGHNPDQETVWAFLENLAIERSLALLKPGERELLRVATLFELPVPLAVLDALAKALALDAGEPCGIRLVGLGLWDVYPDLVRYAELAAAVNALVRPLAGTLTDNDIRALAGVALPALFAGWGGADGDRRPYPADHELARLAVVADQPLGLDVTAEPAIRWLGAQLRYCDAAQLARQAVACLDQHQIEIPFALLRVAGEACVQVGDTSAARGAYQQALARLEGLLAQGQTPDTEDHAYLLAVHSRLLIQDGEPDRALEFLEQAKQLLSTDPRFRREHSIVLGDIARIKVSKGEVDEALKLHQEELTVYQALGDQRSRAVTLGDIARIKVSKGEVDEALKLHQEMLTVFQALGDVGEKAHTLWSIAQIEIQKKDYENALPRLLESYAILLKLGRLDGIIYVGLDLGQFLCAIGEKEQGAAVLSRSRDGFRKLGQEAQARQVQALLDSLA